MKSRKILNSMIIIAGCSFTFNAYAGFQHDVTVLTSKTDQDIGTTDQLGIGYRYYFDEVENHEGPYSLDEFLQRKASISVVTSDYEADFMSRSFDGGATGFMLTSMSTNTDVYYEIFYQIFSLDQSDAGVITTRLDLTKLELRGGLYYAKNSLATIGIIQDSSKNSSNPSRNDETTTMDLNWKSADINDDATTYFQEASLSLSSDKKSLEYSFTYYPDKSIGAELSVIKTDADNSSLDGTTLGISLEYFATKDLSVIWIHNEFMAGEFGDAYDASNDMIGASYRF